MSSQSLKLAACLLNISEGQNTTKIERIARAAVSRNGGSLKIDAAVLNIFADQIYNRSVITIAGTLDGVVDGVTESCREAFDVLDPISHHHGGHPRKGTVDLIPVHPITESTSLADCADVCHRIAENLTPKKQKEDSGDVDFFFFGHADVPEKRSLVQQRKRVDWYNSKVSDLKIHGLTGIGAVPYMSNCNVTVNLPHIKFGKMIASSIRERDGGLLGVQSMAFQRGPNLFEIACNVDTINFDPDNPAHVQAESMGRLTRVFGNFFSPPFEVLIERISEEAEKLGGHVEDSTIIGYSAQEAGILTEKLLKNGQSWAVDIGRRHM